MYVLIIKAKDGRTKLEEKFSEYIEAMEIYNPSGENVYGVI